MTYSLPLGCPAHCGQSRMMLPLTQEPALFMVIDFGDESVGLGGALAQKVRGIRVVLGEIWAISVLRNVGYD